MMSILNDIAPVVNGWALASLVAKVTVVLGVALAVSRLARRRSAAVRHVLLGASFAVLLGLPIASVIAPTIPVSVPGVVRESIASGYFLGIPSDVVRASPASAGVGAGEAAAPPSRFSLSGLVLVGWVITSIAFLLPIAAGLWQTRWLRRSGEPWCHAQSILKTLSMESGIRRRVQVLLHEAVFGPMTCGIVHPTIFLPLDATTWPEEDLRRAITHELEHVRRGDWVTQCFARAVCAGYWFHPMVWVARRRLVLEAERACDDAVLRCSEATAYADQLVSLAERLSTAPSRPLPAMASPGDLTLRVRAVLDQRQQRGRAGRSWMALASVAAALFVLAISSFQVVRAGQLAAVRAPSALLQFDAASVRARPASEQRLAPPGTDRSTDLRCRGIDGELFPPTPGNVNPAAQGRCTGNFVPMENLVATAYAPAFGHLQLIGFPVEFMVTGDSSILYQIQAVAANPSRVTKAELQEMLRALLGERFKLRVHRETREVEGFRMTVAGGGVKFKETTLDEQFCCPLMPQNAGQPIPPEGGIVPVMIKGRTRMIPFTNSVSQLLANETALYGPPIADKTDLAGVYDITLLLDMIAPFMDGGRGGGGGRRQFSPPIAKALEQQLGLRLEPAKVPVEFLFIDHIERPTEN
jgi:uncharacterized protein (TIGR03435 family)